MGLFGFLFNLLISIGLGYIQHQLAKRAARRAQRQAREQFEANAGLDVRPESGGQTIPLAYGATAVQGILAYARTRHTVEDAMVPDTWGTLEHGSSKHFAYLLAQYILCAAGGVTLRDIQIDGIPYDDDQMTKVVAHQIHQAAASDVATAFTDERTTADVFTDLAAVTGVYKYDIDDPIFGGIPRPVFFIEGRQIPRVQSQSALAASKTYSPNAVRVLLDFLLDSVWGPGLDVADIDLASFRRAQLIADRVMQGSASALWDQAYPAALNTLYGTAYSKWSDYFTAVGLTSQSDPGVPGWHGVSAPAVRRYEFHGTLFSTGEWADTVETILEIVPGATLYRSLEGKYKLGLPDPLGSAGTIPQVTDDVLLTPPEVTWPDSDTKLNSVVVRYANVAKDNAADTLEWPPPGSTLATSLLAADGGVALSETVAVEGVNNEFAAAAWGANYVLQSRRALYEWTMGRAGFLYEPGDIVRLNSARMGLDVDVVIQRVSSTREWEARIEAQEYHPVDYLWHTEIKAAALATTLPGLAVPVLADVDADLIPGQLRQISVTWTLPANQIPAIIAFDVEWAEFTAAPDATTERSWRSLGMVPAGGEWALVVTISEAARWYEFRVRARGATGIAGAWTTSNVVAIDAGTYGAAWHSADGTPATDLGKIGDYYLNAETGDVYQKTSDDTWTLEGNIKGDGDEWHSGSGAPANSLGTIGHWYFRTGTNQIYQKTGSSTWTVRATVRAPVWHSGSGAPSTSLGSVGDFYLRLSNGNVYKKTAASTWTLQGNIKADDGDKWHSGSGAPANSLGTVGHWYFRTGTNQIYEKTGSSTWTLRATVRAPVWHSGSGAPSTSLGSVGDFYLRLSNGNVYKKTGSSTWTLQGNIAGDDGDKWHSGSGAPSNSLGTVGHWYFRTGTNQIYEKTGSSTWTLRATVRAPVWHSGSGAPLSGVGNVGDYYLRLSNGDVYKKTGTSTWTKQGNIKADDGDKWHSGSGAPASSLGTVGHWYFRTGTNQIYEKTGSSTWTLRATVRAPVWHSGSGAPSTSLGSVGDFYLNLTNGDVYKKTAASTWTLQGNIKADDGDKWHSGSGAPSNSLGTVGDWYLNTSNYDIYQKTGSSTWTNRGNIKGAAAVLTTGSVQTTHIEQGAVTHETHFSWSGGSVSSSWANMGSQYVSGGTGYRIVVIAVVTFELDLGGEDSSASENISVRIRRGTSTLATRSGTLRANSEDSNYMTLIVAADATHGSGATIAVQADGQNGDTDIVSGVASVLVFKR